MTCDQARKLLHAYLDDELDLATALEIESHLPDCPECQSQLESARIISRAAAQPALYYPATSALRERLTKAIRSESRKINPTAARSWWNRPMAFSGLAAAMLLVVAMLIFTPTARTGEINELISSHLRSTEANHLLDVESTDQHTVKPWFTGKIDFSPPVIDLSAEGFPLIGGRLDYLNQKKVAALIYHRNKHIINLFIWPGDTTSFTDSKQGFNLVRFECKGMTCWAVSDVNAAELQQFVDLFQAQKSASTRS